MSDIPNWHIVGDWFDNCSCAVACPCTFAQAPDNGFCESVLFWHVREGHYGDVKLDNLSFVRVGRWEGDLWARQASGVAGLYIDEHADDRQMAALPAIIGGRAGGFPGWINECFAGGRQARGVERAKIAFEIAPDQALRLCFRQNIAVGAPDDLRRARQRLQSRPQRRPLWRPLFDALLDIRRIHLPRPAPVRSFAQHAARCFLLVLERARRGDRRYL